MTHDSYITEKVRSGMINIRSAGRKRQRKNHSNQGTYSHNINNNLCKFLDVFRSKKSGKWPINIVMISCLSESKSFLEIKFSTADPYQL